MRGKAEVFSSRERLQHGRLESQWRSGGVGGGCTEEGSLTLDLREVAEQGQGRERREYWLKGTSAAPMLSVWQSIGGTGEANGGYALGAK